MNLTIENVLDFVAEFSAKKGLHESVDIEGELSVTADDWHEMIEKFGSKYNVEMTSYLWCFHNEEEGFSFGSIFFKPPYDRARRIKITPFDLLRIAAKQKWDIEYPEHKLPKRRYDLIARTVILLVAIISCLFFLLK